jgi:hypothetical protein
MAGRIDSTRANPVSSSSGGSPYDLLVVRHGREVGSIPTCTHVQNAVLGRAAYPHAALYETNLRFYTIQYVDPFHIFN